MTSPAPMTDAPGEIVAAADERAGRLVAAFEHDLCTFLVQQAGKIGPLLGPGATGARGGATEPAPLPLVAGRLMPGGVVIVTEEGRGIARAVAADLRAMGHPVVRIRHGVGGGGVEGVNLTSSAAVVALLERAREIGPVAAILHVLPLRSRPAGTEADPTHADARGMALLARAAADDLSRAAGQGGACLIAATPGDGTCRDDGDGLAGMVASLARDLAGVRVRRVDFDQAGEVEVQAADLVREALALDLRTEVGYRDGLRVAPLPPAPTPAVVVSHEPAEAVLLGAPDRAAWIDLARALIAWLGENPAVPLIDLAYTLHRDQPAYAFRVGLVARSAPDLAERLRGIVRRLRTGPSRDDPTSLAPPADGREWLHALAADRFARGLAVSIDLLYAGRRPRLLDLGTMADATPAGAPFQLPEGAIAAAEGFCRAMDELIGLQRGMVAALCESAAPAPGQTMPPDAGPMAGFPVISRLASSA